MADQVEEELLNYDEDEVAQPTSKKEKTIGGNYVGAHATGFKDFILKPELMHAINDCGFEHPSQVQQECIPQALLGSDIICQGISGMGKTAVFVISTLQQYEPETDDEVGVLVLAHTRELAFQICSEFKRFSKYLPSIRPVVLIGQIPVQAALDTLKNEKPNIVIATPGRCLDFIKRGHLKVDKVKHFVIDECDKVLSTHGMVKDVTQIFRKLPEHKQVMLFSATMDEEAKELCRKFTHDASEVYVGDASQNTLHGLQHYYVKLLENEKTKKLLQILENFEFNQVVVFVSSSSHARTLNEILEQSGYPSCAIYGSLTQTERLNVFTQFKDFKKRILISTDLTARGIDIERVNIVINYDLPEDVKTYHHRVGRAGRFGTKGLAISFISKEEDQKLIDEAQKIFEVEIKPLPAKVDSSSYMNA